MQFTASVELRDKLERLAALMRSEVPDGDLGQVIERAVTEKLERIEARRFAKPPVSRTRPAQRPPGSGPAAFKNEPPPTSRHIPAAVRRAAHDRDGERCRFVDENGRRCGERARLEFHHRHPFGMGGGHSAENVGLLCRAHNCYLAELDYGHAKVQGRLLHDG